MTESPRSCPRLPRRVGFSLLELVVAAGIFSLCAGYALSTMHHNKRAAETTTRVGDLQQIRRLLTRVQTTLQRAVVLETPGWASAACSTSFLDDEYRRVTVYAGDAAGAPLTREAMEALPEDQGVQLLKRIEEDGVEPVVERMDRDLLLRSVRFFRLGRSLVGFRMELAGDPDATTVQLRKGETYNLVVALDRQVH